MRFRRRGTSRRSSRPRRSMEWIAAVSSPSLSVLDPGPIEIPGGDLGGVLSFWIAGPDTLGSFFDEPTLVRSLIRTAWLISGVPEFPAGTYFAGAVGIIEQVGIADSVPPESISPIDHQYYDWVWLEPTILGNNTLMPGGQHANTAAFYSWTGGEMYDIRSKRRLRSGYGLAVHIQSSEPSGGAASLSFHSRHLLADN